MKIKKEILNGLRCKTFIIEEGQNDYLYQEYEDSTYYQAKKKYDVIKKIKNNTTAEFIPDVYKYINYPNKSVLYTQIMPGESLDKLENKDGKFKFSNITKDLAVTLHNIHSVKDNKYFGWITDDGCIDKYEKFSQFLKSEFIRFQKIYEKYLSKEDIDEICKKESELLNFISKCDDYLKPQLTWFDINPSNIIINNNKLSGIVDPGGAKYTIKELDLAFIRMEVCKNDEEFKTLYNEYKTIDSSLNMEIIKKLSILVELDDIAIRLQDRIFIPIPYCSNFKELIEKIHIN